MWNDPSIKVSAKDIPKHLRSGYKGRKFYVRAVREVEIPADANVWGGGSREQFYAIRLEDGAAITLGSVDAPWSLTRKDSVVLLVQGIAVVRHSIFQGVDTGLTFFIHPDNLPKFIK